MHQLNSDRPLASRPGQQIRFEVYARFPGTDPRVLDAMELQEIGAWLGNHRGPRVSDEEQAELERMQQVQSDRLREVAERRKVKR